ncbi:MAG: PilZ domain-containing protein [Clostridiales bacterium]|nr:PilZ domain-containing protein [Clostridiales bacterium]
MNHNFICEGKATYKKDEERVYIIAEANFGEKDQEFLVHFMDDFIGVFDLYCNYVTFAREGLQYNIVLDVNDVVRTVQRRQDVKVKTNIPVRATLLEFDDKVRINPETMKAMTIQAYLRDISAGGIMIETLSELEINQKLLFPFDKGSTPILITAEVLREQPTESDYHCYGCRYLNNNSGKESVIREYVFRLGAAARNKAGALDD